MILGAGSVSRSLNLKNTYNNKELELVRACNFLNIFGIVRAMALPGEPSSDQVSKGSRKKRSFLKVARPLRPYSPLRA